MAGSVELPYQSTSAFACVDAQSFHTPSDDINAWCQNLPSLEENALPSAQQGFSSPELSASGSSESQDATSQASDPFDAMVGPSVLGEECFSLSADHPDQIVADQYLNLGDETQTQAGSVPSMDFATSSIGPDSASHDSGPSPVYNMAPVHFQGAASHQDVPAYTTMSFDPRSNMQVLSGVPSSSTAQHLPGCPSHGAQSFCFQRQHQHNGFLQYPGHLASHDLSTQTWTMHAPASASNPFLQHPSASQHGPATQYRTLTPKVQQNQPQHASMSKQRPVASRAATGSSEVHQSQGSGLPSPVSPLTTCEPAEGASTSSYANSEVGTVMHSALDRRSEQGATSPVSTLESGHDQDNDGGPGRKSHLYSAHPRKEDGKYHCAFEGQLECTHEPTKLKCNYDKYIDSHLKPYRCKQVGCEELRFSSTACRLRHEREAHGSHGHGVNPYLCLYEGCERSKQDKGFPRAWNRNDHMKRCHGHIAGENDEQTASPVISKPDIVIPNETLKQGGRKRTTKEPDNAAGSKRPKVQVKRSKQSVTSENHQSAVEALEKQQRLHDEWRRRRLQLQEIVHNLQGPSDSAALHRVQSEVNALAAINQELSG